MLSEEDLKYIAPYEDKLFLIEKNRKFIEESKEAIHRVRRRRLNYAIAAVSLIIIALSFLTILAFEQKINAEKQENFARLSEEDAKDQKNIADSLRKEAQLETEKANANADEAKRLQKIADIRKEEADLERTKAARSEKEALIEKNRAEENEKIAIAAKDTAEFQRSLALKAANEAKRLSLLSTAQNIALISMTLEKKPEMMGLLAVQAFNFNSRSGGAIDDPVIFKALDKAYSVLDNNKHSVFRGSENEIRSLSENKDGLVGTDLDGNLIAWTNEGSHKILEHHSPQSFINFISLNPTENKMIIGYENSLPVLRDQIRNTEVNTRLKGHSGDIVSAAWSNDGIHLATGGSDSLILVWNLLSLTGEPEKILKGSSSIRDLVFCNPDSIISSHEDGSIYLWKLMTSSSVPIKGSSAEKPLCLSWDGLRGNILAGTSTGTILFFDLTQKENDTAYASHYAGIDQIIFNDDFSLVATSSWDKVIRIYNYNAFFDQNKSVKGVTNIDDLDSRARTLMFTSDNRLVAGMSDKSIRLWETSSSLLVSKICKMVKRDMTADEWTNYIGTAIPPEKTCGINP